MIGWGQKTSLFGALSGAFRKRKALFVATNQCALPGTYRKWFRGRCRIVMKYRTAFRFLFRFLSNGALLGLAAGCAGAQTQVHLPTQSRGGPGLGANNTWTSANTFNGNVTGGPASNVNLSAAASVSLPPLFVRTDISYTNTAGVFGTMVPSATRPGILLSGASNPTGFWAGALNIDLSGRFNFSPSNGNWSTLDIAAGKIFRSANTLTLTANDGATASFGAGGAVSYLADPVTVAHGGCGATAFTAYALLAGGTTSTGNCQSLAGLGTPGQVLTSNGAGALPTFQAAPVATSYIDFQDASGGNVTVAAGVDTTIYHTTLPAIPAGKCIAINFLVSDAGSNVVTYKLQLNSSSATLFNGSAAARYGNVDPWVLCNDVGSQASQHFKAAIYTFGGTIGATGGPYYALAQNLASAGALLKLVGNASTGADVVTPLLWSVTQLY